MMVLDELLEDMEDGKTTVGIFDATNTTTERRNMVLDRVKSCGIEVNVMFLESVCNDMKTIDDN